MAKQEQKLFRLSQAAHELGLHPITVRRWIKAGRIQVVQWAEVRIPRTEIEKLLATRWAVAGAVWASQWAWAKGDLDTQIERLQAWAGPNAKG